MFRLGCVIPSVTDGTSFYRAAGPLHAMELDKPQELRLEIGGTINWVYLRGVDGVFMQRPYTPDHVRLVSMCRAHGKPVWIDYDDDLYSVPYQNPTHKIYGQKQVHNNITSIIAQADVVTVSTAALQEKLQKILVRICHQPALADLPKRLLSPNKIVLVPNSYDEKLFGYSYGSWKKPPAAPNPCALWRGSHTHDADLCQYTKPLEDAFKADGKGWTLNFVGSPWWGTITQLEQAGIPAEQVIVTPAMDPIDYFHYLHKVKPAFVFVPLVDDPFNRSKSNIGWIEAAHAGAICLAPAWPEWQRPGVVNYRDQEDFRQKFAQLLTGDVSRSYLLQKSREFISENLTLKKVNEQRWKVVECLSAIDPWT